MTVGILLGQTIARNHSPLKNISSLNLDFVKNYYESGSGDFSSPLARKSFSDIITFTRASNGSYFDSSGVLQTASSNEPRFDHDPVTHAPRGLLIEEQRTNLLLQSDNLTTSWTVTSASVSNMSHTRWDGASTTSKLTENTSNSTHGASQSCTITAGNTLTIWTVVESVGGRHVRLQVSSDSSTNGFRAYFDLVNGVVGVASQGFGTGTAVANSATIRPLGGGKFLVAVSGTVDPAATTALCNVFLQQVPSGTALYTGDGTSGLWIHASQLEAGAFPTSYIPTSGSTVTRAADNAIMTGTNFSSWFNQSAGTLVVEWEPVAAVNTFAACITESGNRYIGVRWSPSNDLVARRYDATVADLNFSSLAVGSVRKTGIAYDASGATGFVNGTDQHSSAVAVLPAAVRLEIGNLNLAVFGGQQCIRLIRYFPSRLSNSTLQALTS